MSSQDKHGGDELFELKKQVADAERGRMSAEDHNEQLLQSVATFERGNDNKKLENEDLHQSNYSLNLKLQSTQQTLQCCTAEMEGLQEQLDMQTAACNRLLNSQRAVDERKLKEEVADRTQRGEAAESECSKLQEKLQQSQHRLREAQEAINRAAALSVTHDDTDLQNQIAVLACETQELDGNLARTVHERDAVTEQLAKAQQSLQQISEQLEDMECKMTSYYNEVQRLKEKQLEHKQELELYRMNEKDPKVKGNSLFAEVEDHRLYLEKRMIKLQGYYATVTNQYELKVQEVSRLKIQVTTLLRLGGNKDDGEYVRHLNESLRLAQSNTISMQMQVDEMSRRIQSQIERPIVIQCMPEGCRHRRFYYINTFNAIQAELSETKKLVLDARFQNVLTCDRLLEAQRRLHTSERNTNDAKAEILHLTVQLHDIQAEKGIFTPVGVSNKMRSEIIPNFNADEGKKEIETTSTSSMKKTGAAANEHHSSTPDLKKAATARTERNMQETLATERNIPETSTTERSIQETLTTERCIQETLTTERNIQETSTTENNVQETSTPEYESPLILSTGEVGSNTRMEEIRRSADTVSLLKRKHCSDEKEKPEKSINRMSIEIADDVCEDETSSGSNKENLATSSTTAPATNGGNGKKLKKSVRLQEAVDVQNTDGTRSAASLKQLDGSSDEQKLRKPLRRMKMAVPQPLPDSLKDCIPQ